MVIYISINTSQNKVIQNIPLLHSCDWSNKVNTVLKHIYWSGNMEGGFLGLLQARFLNNKSHIFFGWKINTFALPQWIVDGEGIDGHSQVFGMDLGETLSSGVVSESDKTLIIVLLFVQKDIVRK